jgi:putative nucleotidyltransferase with HDIG domain
MTTNETLDYCLAHEGISSAHQLEIRTYLAILRNQDEKTYEHSVRVGALSSQIAVFINQPGISSRMLLWAGLLHDIGKCRVSAELLRKKERFSEEDRAAIEPHVLYGWEMLNRVHDYTAHIIVRHHRYGVNPYPSILPPIPEHLQASAHIISTAARMLALADFYDALMNRDNDRNGSKPLSLDDKKKLFIQSNKDQQDLIETLEGILFFVRDKQ